MFNHFQKVCVTITKSVFAMRKILCLWLVDTVKKISVEQDPWDHTFSLLFFILSPSIRKYHRIFRVKA